MPSSKRDKSRNPIEFSKSLKGTSPRNGFKTPYAWNNHGVFFSTPQLDNGMPGRLAGIGDAI
jgi:hypothetical protein